MVETESFGFGTPSGDQCNDDVCDPATGVTAGVPDLAVADSATCDADCTTRLCGDGRVNQVRHR